MGKSTKDGRRKSASMPTVRIDRKNKQARVFIGGKQHHLGRVEGGKISPAQTLTDGSYQRIRQVHSPLITGRDNKSAANRF